MNTNIKRGRGRPPGTGLNDAPTLEQIAAMIAATPRLRATTALRRIDPDVNPATTRRIQAKWRANGPRLLKEARARLPCSDVRAPRHSRMNRAVDHDSGRLGGLGSVYESAQLTATQLAAAEVARRLAESIDLATVRAAMCSPAMLAIQQLQNSPAMHAVREFYGGSAVRAMQELHNSPAMRAMRELQDSPAMRAIRDFQGSPAMQAMREAQALVAGVRG